MKKTCNYIFYTLLGVCVGALVYASVSPNKTPQHTSTVSESSVVKK